MKVKLFLGIDYCFVPYRCLCGCNEVIKLKPEYFVAYEKHGYPKFIQGHIGRVNPRKSKIYNNDFCFIPYKCECGCDEFVKNIQI